MFFFSSSQLDDVSHQTDFSTHDGETHHARERLCVRVEKLLSPVQVAAVERLGALTHNATREINPADLRGGMCRGSEEIR